MKKVILFSDVKSAMKKYSAVILAMLTMLTLLSLTGCATSKATIDFEQCVTVEFSGYDGEGIANVKTDSGYVSSLLEDTSGTIELVASFTTSNIENNGNLSNGDTITVKIGTDETKLNKAKVSVKNTELSFTVQGLTKCIMRTSDLRDSDKEILEKEAKDCIDIIVKGLMEENYEHELLNDTYNNTIIGDLYGKVIGAGIGKVGKITNIDNIKFNSVHMYYGKDKYNSAANSPRNLIVYVYDADISYEVYSKSLFETALEDTGKGTYSFALCIPDLQITPDGELTKGMTRSFLGKDVDNALAAVMKTFNVGDYYIKE